MSLKFHHHLSELGSTVSVCCEQCGRSGATLTDTGYFCPDHCDGCPAIIDLSGTNERCICGRDPEPVAPDPEVEYQIEVARIFREGLRPLIERATQDDNQASLVDALPFYLSALKEALTLALAVVEVRRNHDHHWSNSDECLVCGTDGRA